MSVNQLPENMGKKIVEALKKQAQQEIQNTAANMPDNNNMNFQNNTVAEQVIKEQPYINENMAAEEPVYNNQNNSFVNQSFNQAYSQPVRENPMQFSIPNSAVQQNNVMLNAYSSELPANVAVLKNLIFHLPAGVSKQVGAQIIRQTIEALGISMNSVLQEAQQLQETLNNSVTDCTIKIQEYKNQILQLEANARDYQRQMGQINDLISLFILSDKK